MTQLLGGVPRNYWPTGETTPGIRPGAAGAPSEMRRESTFGSHGAPGSGPAQLVARAVPTALVTSTLTSTTSALSSAHDVR